MSSNNQIVLIGRVGNDISQDIKYIADQKVAEVRLGVVRPSKDADSKTVTDWVICKFWNRQAEILSEYVKKGDLISVTGALRIDTYEVDGVNRHKYYILGESFQMMSIRKSA